MSAQGEFAPLTAETFDKSNVTFGKPRDIKDYNHRSVRVGYSHSDSTDDDFTILIKARILHATPPNDNCRTNSALVRVDDQESINFLNQLDADVADMIFKNRKAIFDGIELKGKLALDKLTTTKKVLGYRKKGLLKYSADYNSYSFGITFGNDITVEHSDSIPEEQRNSDDLITQLAKGTEVVIAADLNAISIDTSNLKWFLKLSATQFGCISFTEMGGSKDKDPSDIWGYQLEDIDVSKLVFKDVETNNYGGKSLPVKYAGGKGKEGNLSLLFNDAKVFFLKNENTDKKTGKVTTKFSAAIEIPEQGNFEAIDEAILNHLFKHQDEITDEDPTDDLDIFSDSFNGSLKEREGKYTLWANMYVKNTDGVFDFDGKIFQATGENEEGNPTFEVMSNDDVMSRLVESPDKATANISVYIRYVWLGNSYSVKWFVSKVQTFTKALKKFNLGVKSVARDEEPDEFGEPTTTTSQQSDNEEEDPTAINSADEATSSDEED